MKAKVIGSKEDIARAILSDIEVNGIKIHTGMVLDVYLHCHSLDGETVYSFMGTYSEGGLDSWIIRSGLLEIIED